MGVALTFGAGNVDQLIHPIDAYLQILLPFHIVLGYIAAILLAPIALIAIKGSRWHIGVGRVFYWTTIAVSVTGIMLLLDPNFVDRLLPTEAAFEESIGPWFEPSPDLMKDVFFLYAAIATLVSVISGVRIWVRVRAANPRVLADWRDWSLTLVLGVLAAFWASVGIYFVRVDGMHGERLIITSAALLGFTAVDVWTYWRKPTRDAFPWHVLHAAKMVTVVVFLLLAFQFHLIEILPPPFGSPYVLVALFVALITLLVRFDRRSPKTSL